ncbi:MAG: tandem-95 repeat protein, partial [Hyphomicrobiales bacterium]|nr:tandem-95 repeat protein [Hyphomicrobiales bacterium]
VPLITNVVPTLLEGGEFELSITGKNFIYEGHSIQESRVVLEMQDRRVIIGGSDFVRAVPEVDESGATVHTITVKVPQEVLLGLADIYVERPNAIELGGAGGISTVTDWERGQAASVDNKIGLAFLGRNVNGHGVDVIDTKRPDETDLYPDVPEIPFEKIVKYIPLEDMGTIWDTVTTKDLSRAFVATDKGIAVIDTFAVQQFDVDFSTPELDSIVIPGDGHVTSLALDPNGQYLYAAGTGQIYVIDINPGSSRYNQVSSVITGFDAPASGRITDIAVNADGTRLFATVPRTTLFGGTASWTTGGRQGGSVVVINVDNNDRPAAGEANTAYWRQVIGELRFDDRGRQFIEPYQIKATTDRDRMIFTSRLDIDEGLHTLRITNNNASSFAAEIKTINLTLNEEAIGPFGNNFGQAFDLNINNAAAVAVTSDLKYALVSDWYVPRMYSFVDPYVALELEDIHEVGSKVAIVVDPFTSNAHILAATTPIPMSFLEELEIDSSGRKLYASFRGAGNVAVYNLENMKEKASSNFKNWHRTPLDHIQTGGLDINEKPIDVEKYGRGLSLQVNQVLNLISPEGLTDISQEDETPLTFEFEIDSDLLGPGTYRARLFISALPPGDGLWDDDTWLERGRFSDDPDLDDEDDTNPHRILTSGPLLFGNKYVIGPDRQSPSAPAGDAGDPDKIIVELDDVIRKALTAGQVYYWGVELLGTGISKSTSFVARPVENESTYSSVTILTHGFQLDPTPDLSNASFQQPQAFMDMAQLIADAGGGGAVLAYDKNSGEWVDRVSYNGQSGLSALIAGKPVVLVSDWYRESDISDSGFAEAAADALFAALVKLDQETGGTLGMAGGLLSSPLHFIGHSRGTSVNSEIIQRLGTYYPGSDSGIGDIHMTTLDPHEFEQKSLDAPLAQLGEAAIAISTLAAGAAVAYAAYTWNPTGLTWALRAAKLATWVQRALTTAQRVGLQIKPMEYADFKDPDVKVWSNVSFADNYYQEAAAANPEPGILYPSFTATPNGRSIPGADIDLDMDIMAGFGKEDFGGIPLPVAGSNFGAGGPHSRVWQWYAGTIDLGIFEFEGNPIWRRIGDEGIAVEALGLPLPGYQFNRNPWYLSYPATMIPDTELRELYANFVTGGDNYIYEGITTGWYYSAIGGGLDYRPQRNLGRTAVTYDNTEVVVPPGQPAVPTVFNGSFENGTKQSLTNYLVWKINGGGDLPAGTGRFPLSYELPGWSLHGGDGFDVQLGSFGEVDIAGLFSIETSPTEYFKTFVKAAIDSYVDGLFQAARQKLQFFPTAPTFDKIQTQMLKKGLNIDVSNVNKYLGHANRVFNAGNLAIELLTKVIEKIGADTLTHLANEYLPENVLVLPAGSPTGLPLDADKIKEYLHFGIDQAVSLLPSDPSDHALMMGAGNAIKILLQEFIPDGLTDVRETLINYFEANFELEKITHNRMVIPADSQYLRFNVWTPMAFLEDSEVVITFTKMDGTHVSVPPVQIEAGLFNGKDYSVEIPAGFAGEVATFTVEHRNMGATEEFRQAYQDMFDIDFLEGIAVGVVGGISQLMLIDDFVFTTTPVGAPLLADGVAEGVGEVEVGVSVAAAVSAESVGGGVTVVNRGSDAGFHNAYGYVLLDDAGEPAAGHLIWADVKDTVGESFTIAGADPDRVLFFLVPNGDGVNPWLADGMEVTVRQDGGGRWQVYGADGRMVQPHRGLSVHFSDPAFNLGGATYVSATAGAGNQNWEDLDVTHASYDGDMDDAAFTVAFQAPAAVAEPVAVTVDLSAAAGARVLSVRIAGLPAGAALSAGQREDDGTWVVAAGDLDGLTLSAAPGGGAVTLTARAVYEVAGPEVSLAEAQALAEVARGLWTSLGPFADMGDRLASVGFEVADLDGRALAYYDGNTIVIDRDAAGNGWFIDPTPLQSEEFDPSGLDWLLEAAVQGSPAGEGYDLLTVIAHEYGHALGLVDVPAGIDPTRLMSDSVTPGARRLPSAADLPATDVDDGAVDAGPAPVQVGAIALPAAAGGDAPAAPQYLNGTPTLGPSTTGLQNGTFDDGSGWTLAGAAGIAGGEGVLDEGDQVMSGLIQAFLVPDTATQLRFTLTGLDLGATEGEPPDAFEVAFLDTAAGTPLLGTAVGLGNTDALINIQADGTAFFAAGVSIEGAGASGEVIDLTTPILVTVDLTTLPPSTDATLTFDLLGFGALDSQVRIDDVRAVGAATGPEASKDIVSVAEDTATALDVQGNDGNAGVLAVEIVDGPAHGGVTVNPDGTVTYAPDLDFNGEDGFTYRLVDGTETSNTAAVVITVTAANDPPTLAAVGDLTVAEGETAEVTLSGGDVDLLDADTTETLSYSLVSGPAGAVVDPDTGAFAWTADDGPASHEVTVRVTDGGGLTAERTFTVHVTDVAPTVSATGASQAQAGVAYSVALSATDPGADTVSQWTVDWGDGTVDVLAGDATQASHTYAAAGPRTVKASASNEDGTFAAADLSVEVVDGAVIAVQGDGFEVDEDTATALDVQGNDGNGAVLTVEVVDGPAHGTAVAQGDGTVLYTPDGDYNGPDSFTYRLTDGGETSGTATVDLTVRPVNDDPTLAAVADVTVAEGGLVEVALAGDDVDLLDAGGTETLTYGLVSGPAGAAVDPISGAFTWTADDGPASHEVTVRVTDGGGLTAERTFTIDVTDVAPTLAATGANGTEVGALYTIGLSATDPGDDTITSWTVDWGDGAVDILAGTATQASHTYAAPGERTVRVSAGNEDGLFDAPDLPVNVFATVPGVVDDGFTLAEDTATALDVQDNDGNGAVLTPVLVDGPAHGLVTAQADGTFLFTPDLNYHGGDTFTYRLLDGGQASTVATVTLTVTAVNDDPTLDAVDDVTVDEGSEVTVNLVAHDVDLLDDGSTEVLTYSLVAGPAGAAVDPDSGAFTWTADDGPASHEVTVRVTDGGGLTAERTFTIDVTDVAPSVGVSGATETHVDAAYVLSLSYGDPGADPVQSWTIDWGDGTVEQVGAVAEASHVYTAAGPVTIRAAVDNGDGTFDAPALAVSVQPVPLMVEAFTATATGFHVRFNHAFAADDINLTTSVDTPLGTPDVTLVGDLVGAVSGSLVLDGDGEGLTFIRTGGVLQFDSYTVVLDSGPAAFHDDRGDLDGDGDGAAGGDFVTTFDVLGTGEGVIALPDFMRGPGQHVDVPAWMADLPVTFTSHGGVKTLVFTVDHDADKLAITGATAGAGLPAGAEVRFETAAGPDGRTRARITVISDTALGDGAVELVKLQADVPDDAVYGGKQVLDLTVESVNGGAADFADDDALHVVGYVGDGDGDAIYSTLDVQRILRVGRALDSGFSAWRMVDPLLVADVNLTGTINALDASRVHQELMGLDRREIPPLPLDLLIQFGGPDPLVSIPTDLVGAVGDVVTVPVRLDTAAGLEAARMRVVYDPAALELVGVSRGGLTGEFDIYAERRESGAVEIDMARLWALDGGFGELAELQFRILPGAVGPLLLDLHWASLNSGRLTLNPAPVPGLDPTDGRITVTGPAPRAATRVFSGEAGAVATVAVAPVTEPGFETTRFALTYDPDAVQVVAARRGGQVLEPAAFVTRLGHGRIEADTATLPVETARAPVEFDFVIRSGDGAPRTVDVEWVQRDAPPAVGEGAAAPAEAGGPTDADLVAAEAGNLDAGFQPAAGPAAAEEAAAAGDGAADGERAPEDEAARLEVEDLADMAAVLSAAGAGPVIDFNRKLAANRLERGPRAQRKTPGKGKGGNWKGDFVADLGQSFAATPNRNLRIAPPADGGSRFGDAAE